MKCVETSFIGRTDFILVRYSVIDVGILGNNRFRIQGNAVCAMSLDRFLSLPVVDLQFTASARPWASSGRESSGSAKMEGSGVSPFHEAITTLPKGHYHTAGFSTSHWVQPRGWHRPLRVLLLKLIFAVSQEIPHLLRNQKVRYHILNRPPFLHTVSQMNQVRFFAHI